MNKEIFSLINEELKRQKDHVELIASENFVSEDILNAQGSILTNKYAEGYPNKRYYGGCEIVDRIEQYAIDKLKELFLVSYANVQPHSGSQANMAAYQALLKPGDTILGMSLDAGGHLTHGYNLNFSGKYYQSVFYSVSRETELIDYDELEELAKMVKPQLIVAGASSYSRVIDFKRFREIADKVGAYLMVDMAHIAGLVAAKLHPSPIPYADVITSTTHKTMRGPRGGFILCNDLEISKRVDKALFPGVQGGPLMHVIAAKGIAFNEALNPKFVKYQEQVLKNAKALEREFKRLGYRIVSDGTDNHLLLLDVKKKFNFTGLRAEQTLDKVNITVNKNGIPYDLEKPAYTSGIRIGTPAMTTRGMKEEEMIDIANFIDRALKNYENDSELVLIREEVISFIKNYPLY